MRKIIGGFMIGLLFGMTGSMPVSAENRVNTIEVEAVIYADGSMYVTQTWEGDFDEGTENYIPMNAPEYLTISDLQVADGNGTYETKEEWDIDAGFEEKAGKCGVLRTDGGYEICFGISNYGHNRYAIEYRLDQVVGSYTDRDGVNFCFVGDGMNTTPTDVTVDIRLADGTEITDEIADIWGFGFDGSVAFDDGAIRAYTESPIYADNYVTVLFSFEPGILTPRRQEGGSFAAVEQEALSGSDYDDYDDYDYSQVADSGDEEVTSFEMLIGTLILLGAPAALVVFCIRHSKRNRKKQLARFGEQHGYFRELPNSGNMCATYVLGRLFDVCEESAILATGMVRLVDIGAFAPSMQEETGFLGRTSEHVTLRLVGGAHGRMNEYDEYLYTVLEGAAGADGILQEKELERFAAQHDGLLRGYINKCDGEGRSYLSTRHCLKRWDSPARLQYLTPDGERELGELLGFRRYLEDFSLIAERGVGELPIWRELLSYAMLLGIAEHLAQQLQLLYPEVAAEIASYNQNLHAAYACQHLLYRNMIAAEELRQQQRSSGGGGMASLGGGGGSIGGGSGGGSR